MAKVWLLKTRRCPKCREDKPPSSFSTSPRRAHGLSGYCKRCRSISESARHAGRQERAREIKLARGCRDCGYRKNPTRLDFDHLPEHEKLFNIAQAIGQGVAWCRIEAEIEKCEVVCKKCHLKRTLGRLADERIVRHRLDRVAQRVA